ncbi:MAG: alpha-ribazole phosphatase [Bacteroidota bacterium]
MEIYLVRHTTPNIEKGVCYGQADIDVTQTFESEVKRIEQLLPDGSKCISSPLLRCRRMADRISESYELDNRLKEMSFGEWEQKKWSDINETSLNQWMQDFVNNAPPRGESFNDLMKRVLDFWNDLTKNKSAEKIVVCTHGGVIRSIVAQLLSMPLEQVFNFHLDFASLTKVAIHHQQFRLEYLNR